MRMQVVTLVGGELAEPEGGARLSKAQRKNARRLERKAAQRAATDVSVASSDVCAQADAACRYYSQMHCMSPRPWLFGMDCTGA